jgi:hypothetical protein
MGNISSHDAGPVIECEDLLKFVTNMKQEDEYKNARLKPVQEILLHSFIHPKDDDNPVSITSGVLTGGDPLWAFTVDEQNGQGDLYYYVYDTKVMDHRVDGTWVVEHLDFVLVKAQIGVEGYLPKMKTMLDSAIRIHGGYTKFTPAMIHRICIPLLTTDWTAEMMVKTAGCLHSKEPAISKRTNFPGALVDLICEHRLRPAMDMPIQLSENEIIVSKSSAVADGSCKQVSQDD